MKPTTEMLARREQWAKDGARAWNEYLAAPNAVADKTARLKAERLEKEAVDKIAAEKAAIECARLKDAPKTKKSHQTGIRRKAKVTAENAIVS